VRVGLPVAGGAAPSTSISISGRPICSVLCVSNDDGL
jgi:hypothetical protein